MKKLKYFSTLLIAAIAILAVYSAPTPSGWPGSGRGPGDRLRRHAGKRPPTGAVARESGEPWFEPSSSSLLSDQSPYGQTASAPVSVIAGEATPSGLCQVRLWPVTASRTVSSYSTSVAAAAKTQ